jgi:hypothetical protein
MKILISLLAILSFSAFAQNIKVEFTKICALPDDKVIDKVNFAMLATSTEVAGTQFSKTMSVTPGFCKKASVASNYNLNLWANTLDFSNPLRLQIAEPFLNHVWVPKKQAVYIGTKLQLRRQECDYKHYQCIDIEDLKREDKIVVIETKSQILEFKLSI